MENFRKVEIEKSLVRHGKVPQGVAEAMIEGLFFDMAMALSDDRTVELPLFGKIVPKVIEGEGECEVQFSDLGEWVAEVVGSPRLTFEPSPALVGFLAYARSYRERIDLPASADEPVEG